MAQVLRLLPALSALLIAGGSAAEEGLEEGFSEANTLLFLSDHLAQVDDPAVLHYAFRRQGTLEEGFADVVELRITGATSQGKQVELTFLSGDRQRLIPSMSEIRGNPVIMLFLQRDVNEMGRLTGGPWRHFQQRIKLALAEAADVTTVSVPFDDASIDVTKIKIVPYREDPERERFAEFAGKYYEFLLSEKVPGQVYAIRAVVPGKAGGGDPAAPPLVEEVLTYEPGATPAG